MRVPTYKRKLLSWCQNNECTMKSTFYKTDLGHKVSAYHIYKTNKTNHKLIYFIHGAGNSALYPFAHFFPQSLEHGFDILTFDLDGHGSNSTTLFDPENSIDCLSIAIKNFKDINYYPEIFAIGHSLGGAILINYLKNNIESIFNRVAIWSTPTVLKVDFKVIANEFFGVIDANLFQAIKFYGPIDIVPSIGHLRRPELPFRAAANSINNDFFTTIQKAIDLCLHNIKTKAINTKALLMYGSEDTIAKKDAQDKIASYFKDATLINYPKATHTSMIFAPQILEQTLSFFTQN